MKWLTLPARFFGSTNSEDATSPLQPVWACVRYGAQSSIGVHMPKCANTALKTVPRTAKAMMNNSAGVDLGASALPGEPGTFWLGFDCAGLMELCGTSDVLSSGRK
jgi:hypothetical protein